MVGPGCLSYGWIVYTESGGRLWFPCESPLPKSVDLVFHGQVMPLILGGLRLSRYEFVCLDNADNVVDSPVDWRPPSIVEG